MDHRVVHFDVDSYLLLQLGEALFAKKALALAELVKNGYDEDATKVIIRFENVTKPGGTIVVEDNGGGMTYDEMVEGWMRIATYIKNRNPFSKKFDRPRAGAKGVGRFASRVLSSSLVLLSVAIVSSGRKEEVRAEFDWRKFEIGSKVNDVAILSSVQSVPYSTPTGTRLVLKDVPDVWTKEEMQILRNELFSLISVFTPEVSPVIPKSRSDPGFQVIMQSPEFREEEGPLSERFLELSAWGRLVGELDRDGKARFTLVIRQGQTKLQYNADATFSSLGPAKFRIDMVTYRKEHFPGLDVSLRDAQKIGREHGGVRIYVDGFRVLPYGEPSDDWLNLDSDRARRLTAFREFEEALDSNVERPMLLIPGNNQLFGGVLLSRVTNPEIHITLTRDRLLENQAFDELRSFVRLGIEWMTLKYAQWVAKQKATKRVQLSPIAALDAVEASIQRSKGRIGPEASAEILQSMKLARDAFEQREDDRISEISMLRVLATTGTLMLTFQHELVLMVDDLKDIGEDLSEMAKKLQGTARTTTLAACGRIIEWVTTVREYGKQLGLLLGIESRSRRQSYAIKPLIDTIAKPFGRHFLQFGIAFHNETSPDLSLPPMYRAEVGAIFLNILTNSTKAVKERSKREIRIDSEETDAAIKIRVLDSGPGVAPDLREEIFEPFVTYSKPDPMFGEGTGLGLTIVRNLLDTYGGKAQFIDPPKGWGSCLEITLPKE